MKTLEKKIRSEFLNENKFCVHSGLFLKISDNKLCSDKIHLVSLSGQQRRVVRMKISIRNRLKLYEMHLKPILAQKFEKKIIRVQRLLFF